METYYLKKGKKYIPIGVSIPNDIPFGVWYVRKTDYGSASTNILYWQTNEVVDIKKACQQIDLAEEIAKALSQLDKESFSLYNTSLHDFAKKIAQQIL